MSMSQKIHFVIAAVIVFLQYILLEILCGINEPQGKAHSEYQEYIKTNESNI